MKVKNSLIALVVLSCTCLGAYALDYSQAIAKAQRILELSRQMESYDDLLNVKVPEELDICVYSSVDSTVPHYIRGNKELGVKVLEVIKEKRQQLENQINELL